MKTSHVSCRQRERDMAAPDRHRVVALEPDTIAEGVRSLVDCDGLRDRAPRRPADQADPHRRRYD